MVGFGLKSGYFNCRLGCSRTRWKRIHSKRLKSCDSSYGFQALNCDAITEIFWPPNPKLLVSAIEQLASRATLGM